MPALSDRSFNPQAWRRLGLVAVGLGVVAGSVVASYWMYDEFIDKPRVLSRRFDDPLGRVSTHSILVADLGPRAVPTLLGDLASAQPDQRSKALELLASIDDPQVVPALGKALADSDIGVRMSAVSGLARTGKPEAGKYLWPLLQNSDDLLRLRAEVALGLCGEAADATRLLTVEIAKVQGSERHVMAWAAGRILRRLALESQRRVEDRQKQGQIDTPGEAKLSRSYVPAAPVPQTDDEAVQMQADVSATLAAIDAGKDLEAQAKRLDELTDLGFDTWNIGHQVAAQVLAIQGPLAFRHPAGSDTLAPARNMPTKLDLHRPKADAPSP